MVLQSTGQIFLSDIQNEFGGSNPIFLSEYYQGGTNVNASVAGIPANGMISINMFRGKSAAQSPIPTDGLYAWYDGDSFIPGTKWVNKSGDTTRDITSARFIDINGVTLNTHTTGWKYLSGASTCGIYFPANCLTTTYTMFHIAKYNGTTKGRIFDAHFGDNSKNWLSGFHGGNAGVAFHLSDWITSYTNLHGNNWVMSSDQNDPPLYRSNGVNRTLTNVTHKLTSSADLAISVNERSDWAVAEVILYTRTLTTSEILSVESYLRNKYTESGV
jgi:hypothetical protein